MAHFFSNNGFTVLQAFGWRFQVVNRQLNPIISSCVFPVYQKKELRIWKYGISLTKV